MCDRTRTDRYTSSSTSIQSRIEFEWCERIVCIRRIIVERSIDSAKRYS